MESSSLREVSGYGSTSSRRQDAEAIARIYNEGIVDRVATFETRLRTEEAEVRGWLDGLHG